MDNVRKVNPATPATIKCAIDLYRKLDELANEETLSGQTYKIYRGSLLKAFSEASSSRTYYTPAYALLTMSGAITLADKGGRSTPSIAVLHAEPTVEELCKIDREDLTIDQGASRIATDTRLNDFLASVKGLDIPKAFLTIDQELREIRERIRKLELKN